MKKNILILILLFPLIVSAQGFYIKKYNVQMSVRKSGKIFVTERILVNFTEKRRGIIRSIPILYYISDEVEGEKSTRAEPSNKHFIKISKPKVNRNFADISNDSFWAIRIGDADKYLSGLQLYVISYSVEGVVNTFKDRDELSWNLIGNSWDVPIEKINFSVKFEGNPYLSKKDVKITTGKIGSLQSDVVFNLGSSLSGRTTREFKPNEALTLSLSFKKKYFKKSWKLTDIQTDIKILEGANCEISEKIVVNYSIFSNGFTYKIPRFRIDENGEKKELILKKDNVFTHYRREYRVVVDSANYVFHIGAENRSSKMLFGSDTVNIEYEIWGAVFRENEETFFEWNFFNNISENNFTKGKISISLPSNYSFSEKNIQNLSINDRKYLKIDKILSFYNKRTGKNLKMKVKMPKNAISSILSVEYIKNARDYIVKNLNSEIEITKKQEVKVRETLNLVILNKSKMDFVHSLEFSSEISPEYYFLQSSRNILVDRSAIFDEYYKPLIYNTNIDKKGYILYNRTFYWDKNKLNERFSNLDFSYNLYDVVCKTDSGALVAIPLYLGLEPIFSGKCKIVFSEKINKNDLKCFLDIGDKKKQVNFSIEGRSCIIDFETVSTTYKNKIVALNVLFPEELASDFILGKELELFFTNNKILFILPALLLILFVIWYFTGRDYEYNLQVRYMPPENITPAEAGLLWDDFLHNRDMISLVYYWASNGYVEIIESERSSISLKKTGELPSNAREYEKTIFEALFPSKKVGEVTALSSLKTPFAKAFKKAFAQMKAYSLKNGFYLKTGTFFSRLYFVFAVISLLGAIIFPIVGDNTREITFTLFVSAVIFYIFSTIMRKKSLHASKIYAEIAGFKEFIKTAELERLKILSNENPKYFEETIAYAIILGYGRLWAEKFSGFLTVSPSWYKSADGTKDFNTEIFTKTLVSNMYKMEKSFNYKPPKPKRTYSSSSYSSSSSTSSSWSSSWSKSSSVSSSSSWSGSSSFSSSGGSAGSGYGGGGGSSW